MSTDLDEADLPAAVEAIQPEDDAAVEEAVRGSLRERATDRAQQDKRDRDAVVRKLLHVCEGALSGDRAIAPEKILHEIALLLEDAADLADVLDPSADALANDEQLALRRFLRARRQARAQGDPPEAVDLPPVRELALYNAAAQALGWMSGGLDKTAMAPVYFEPLEAPGAGGPDVIEPGDDRFPTPFGRVRVAKDSSVPLERRAVGIPHDDCEHIMVIANPRQGKDSLIARMAGNLKDEHGYKWLSVYDDGRNETPCIAIPNDETAIRENLANFGQEPKGYDTRVYCPAVNLPDELPANHEAFSISVGSLTPDIMARIAGVDPDRNTEQRLKHALETVRSRDGAVDTLIAELQELSGEISAQVTMHAEQADGTTRARTRTIPLGDDDDLEQIAETLVMLSSRGLIRDIGAETNLDMAEVIAEQETVAVLNCNYLPEGDEALKYLLVNLWLRLIYRARDENAALPRAAVELREIKELAPSKLGDVKYSGIIKGLRRTIKFISSNGGSRGVLMLGSVQKLNDLYKPVRGNMPIKVLLQMGGEKIRTLESAGYSFSSEEWRQIQTFDTGWGMLQMPNDRKWPVNWCGARCGLGLKDIDMTTRYGWAMGYRALHYDPSPAVWERLHGAPVYVDVDGAVQEAPPEKAEWFLTPRDLVAGALVDESLALPATIQALTHPEDVEEALEAAGDDLEAPPSLLVASASWPSDDAPLPGLPSDLAGSPAPEEVNRDLVAGVLDEAHVKAALSLRRDYPVQDLRPEAVDDQTQQRHLDLVPSEDAAEGIRQEIVESHGIQGPLKQWLQHDRETVRELVATLDAIYENSLQSYGEIGEASPRSSSTASRWITQEGCERFLGECVRKADGEYQVTPTGKRALEIDWMAVFDDMRGV